MRSFALGSFALALGLVACNRETSIGSMTGTTGDGTTGSVPDGTTADDPATTTAAATSTTGAVTSTTAPVTTADPATTDATTGEAGATTLVGTTGAPPVFPAGGPFGRCSNAMGAEIACEPDGLCLDEHNVGSFNGAFCSPSCESGPCPTPPDLAPSIEVRCAFDSDGDSKPDLCALLCDLDADECPGDMTCDDVGIPKMKNKSVGVCTWLKG